MGWGSCPRHCAGSGGGKAEEKVGYIAILIWDYLGVGVGLKVQLDLISHEIYFVLLRLIKEQKSKVQKVRITNLWLFSTISLKPHTAHLFLRSLTNTMVSNIQLQNNQGSS